MRGRETKRMCVCVCVCVRERVRENKREHIKYNSFDQEWLWGNAFPERKKNDSNSKNVIKEGRHQHQQ